MYVLNITKDYDGFTNCTGNENDDIKIYLKHLLLSVLGGVILQCLINLMIWNTLKPLF